MATPEVAKSLGADSSEGKDASAEGTSNNNNENGDGNGPLDLKDVTDPRDTDVLCGRGGAALRHPGNQTYRRLVNLNKGLYITCLKTEKLKISRSIVAAIREQQGRFLEKNTKKGSWFDIGDKKAIEKTSQALREGQPKLRQKMVEMGGLPPPNGGISLDAQYAAAVANSNNGIYTTPGMQQQQRMGGFDPSAAAAFMAPHPALTHHQQQAHIAQQQHLAAQQQQSNPNARSNAFQDMPPPRSRGPVAPPSIMPNASLGSLASIGSSIGAGAMSPEMQADLLRMSLNSMNTAATAAAAAAAASLSDADSTRSSMRARLRPSITGRMAQAAQELGIAESNLSLWSNFSGMSAADINRSMGAMSIDDSINGGPHNLGAADPYIFGGGPVDMGMVGVPNMQNQFQQQQQQMNQQHMNQQLPPPPPMPPSAMASPSMGGMSSPGMPSPSMRNFDRRRLFARMKYKRPPSQRSIGDGMPDIHPVESSTFSLLSNLSAHNSQHAASTAAAAANNNVNNPTGAINMSAGYDANNIANNNNNNNNNNNANNSNNNNNPSDNGADNNANGMQKDGGTSGRANSNNPGMAFFGSRRSLMSGLSRISDRSDEAGSIFSDLSRKIGNVSTRSIAVSEISGIEEEAFHEDLEGFNLDPLAGRGGNTTHSVRMTDSLPQGSTHTATMEFADG